MIGKVTGHQINLRLVQSEDAAYIHALRQNPVYNRHLSIVTGTVDDQRDWIETYKTREADGLEYYFIIERKDGMPCGVVRLYEITNQSFTWGSWILDHNKPSKAALESAVLSFGVGFKELNISKSFFEAKVGNSHAIAFYRRFGATVIERDTENIYFELSRKQFLKDLNSRRQAIESSE